MSEQKFTSQQTLPAMPTMPGRAPLAMPMQDLEHPFVDPNAPGPNPIAKTSLYRRATFIPALLTTLALIAIFSDWFRKDGFAAVEITMLVLVGFSAFWIALSVSASTIGLFFTREDKVAPQSTPDNALNVALLAPIYNEDPEAVFNRLKVMRDQLAQLKTNHRYSIFILSDTRDDRIALHENQEFNLLKRTHLGYPPVYYRRRANNTERKSGNLRDWILNYGNDWDAFITLDADSLMSAETITRLADELSFAEDTALIQSVPHLIGSNTLFSRVQQFANNIYGGVLASGLDRWSGNEGNFWGHNAIARTKAFAASAGLPKLSGSGALGGTIKSHDFVEAALLRRAGWAVRIMPALRDSYEDIPQNIVDYVLRDRRWCQGNLQHLRLIGSAGFAPASRFHMLQGATAYIASVTWFLLLIAWALMGRSEEQNIFRYFSDANPLFPQWPQMDAINRAVILGFMIALLLLPKIFAIISTIWKDHSCKNLGGRSHFAASAISEILLSFLLAPILMVQHVTAVGRTILGLDAGWAPQNRAHSSYGWLILIRFHWLETITGIILVSGLFVGVISLWLVPIAFSLIGAVPISYLFGMKLSRRGLLKKIMNTQEDIAPSAIIRAMSGKSGAPLPERGKQMGSRLKPSQQ